MTDTTKNLGGAQERRQGLKLLIELAPLLVFFAAVFQYGILYATVALTIATVVALVVSYILFKKIAPMPLISGGLVLLFGMLTWYFQDKTFIKIKPTIAYLLFAAPLLGGLLFKRSLLQSLLGETMKIDADGWRRLTMRWGLFFVTMAILNEVVWRNFSDNTWAALKVFGFLPLTLVFGLMQMPLILRHQTDKSSVARAAQRQTG